MITVKHEVLEVLYQDVKPGQVFSWPVDEPRKARAFGLKLKEGFVWLHSAGNSSHFAFDPEPLSDIVPVQPELSLVVEIP